MDTIVYIQCPEVIESPVHENEYQVIDGVLRDICDILKYSFVVNENRSITYFGRKIDLDYSLERDTKSLKTALKYSFMLKSRCIMCECDITKVLNDMKLERAFCNDYMNLIKSIVKNIGEKSVLFLGKRGVELKFVDMKRHYIK